MSDQIYVYNKSNRRITVQCYEKGSSDTNGELHEIEPLQSKKVSETGFFQFGDIDLEIKQVDTVTTADGNKKDVTVKKTRFTSDDDHSWIVKEEAVVRQEYGKSLEKEQPNGKQHKWKVTADKIILKNVHYLNLPNQPDEWKPEAVYSTQFNNNSSDAATITQAMSMSCSETADWSNNVGITVSVSAEAECGVPLLGKSKVTVGVEGTFEYRWGRSYTKTFNWSPSMSIDMNPKTTIDVNAQIMTGILTVAYTATMILEYKGSDDRLETEITGEYTGVCATKAVITTSDDKPLATDNNVQPLRVAEEMLILQANVVESNEPPIQLLKSTSTEITINETVEELQIA